MNYSQFTLNVFVYGTLKPGEINFQHYCGRQIKSSVAAYTWGNLYDLPVGYPAMIEGHNKVQGNSLSFDTQEILSDLDQLEDYQEKREMNLNQYYRLAIAVYAYDDQFLTKAWAYFMTKSKVNQYRGTLIKSGIWSGR